MNYRPVITVETNGCFDSLNDKFEKLKEIVKLGTLDKYGRQGVEALRANTPVDTGKTAASWEYKIVRKTNSIAIQWYNTNKNRTGNTERNGGVSNGLTANFAQFQQKGCASDAEVQ